MSVSKTPIARITVCALFTALIAVLAQIALPLPFSPVPFTGQLIGVLIAASLLGSRTGFTAVGAYLLLGAAGAPVFSLARGGIHMLTGPTGGYLWGFLPAVYLTGLILEKTGLLSAWLNAVAMLPALGLIYFAGALQLGLIMNYSAAQAFWIGVVPFVPLDLAKISLAAILSVKIKKSLLQNRLGHLLP